MGQEILYCAICSSRVLGSDVEKGKAVKAGHRAACPACREELLASLSPGELRALERAAPAPSRTPSPTPRTGMAHLRSSTRRIPVQSRTSALPLLGGLGALILVGVIVAVAGGGSSTPPAARQETPSLRQAKPPEVPTPAPPAPDFKEELRLALARKALKEAQETEASGNVDRIFAAWSNALRAADQTPVVAEAQRGYAAAEARRKAVWKAAMEEGEAEIKAALDALEVEKARAVVGRLKALHPGPEWDSKVQEIETRLRRAEAEVAARLAEARPWTPVFDGRTRDFIRDNGGEGFEAVDGAVVLKSRGSAAQSKRIFGDGEIRLRFEASDVSAVFFAVRQGSAGAYRVAWEGPQAAVLKGAPVELRWRLKGKAVEAWVDGVPVPVQAIQAPSSGCFQFNANAGAFKLTSLEFRELP
jgi:hypothetical protein